ncbi:ABC transporter substrate-binding protein [Streptomyces filamentosus]|uniref:Peptide-binding protein n=1 Tax=Streptomyces filamentosus TaxID=67294 RepID=A0A919BUY8_STRFL|nr:ABC transporter substrate-binding protein [Streptomyces filamentosus]KAA6216802.1 peptide-binding protein [Streptomyces filamentosus]GHG19945.1 peptide-binding protein [Streptomyces filamentosus]
MNRKTMVLPAVAGLLAPLLAACGAGEESRAIVVGTTDQFVATEEAPAPLDPAYAYDTGTWNILRQTVQTLVHVPRGGGAPVPEAAETCGFSDRASESYRCVLRPGLTFADGTPVTAEDVKYSIDRVRKIKADNGAAALLSTVDTVETKGDREVVFHLNAPDATFPYKLSTPVAGILSKDKYAADELREGFEVDGSGPYTLKAERDGDRATRFVFSRNPRYKGDITPRNEKVELRAYADAGAMGTALESKDIDMMARSLSQEQIRDLTETPKAGIRVSEVPGLEIRYLGFNTKAPSVEEKAVRQAMAAVVDRGALVNRVYGPTAEPLYSLIPSSITGHSTPFYEEYGEGDADRAAAILRKAGVKTPVRLTLNYTTDHYGAETAQEFATLKNQLIASELFDVQVKGTSWSEFRPAQKRGDYAVYGLGWFPDYPDPDNYVAPFLDSDNFLGTPYVNKTVRDHLIPRSRRQADRNAATPDYRQIQKIVAQDVPVLPLWQGKQYVAARDDISGVEYALNTSSDLLLWELGRGTA